MASVFAGLRSTADFETDERPKDFKGAILRLDPNGSAPMVALSKLIKSEGATDPEFAWFEETSYVPRCITTGALSTSSTAVTLQAAGTTGTKGDGLSFVVGDLLLVEKAVATGSMDNEIVAVTAITNATTITISRAAAGSTAAAIPTASFLTKIGNAFAEGSDAPENSTRNPTKYYNYTQIFKHTYRITNTTKATNFRTGDPLKNDKNRKMFDHAASLEYAMIFGRRSEDLTGSEPKRTTGGLLDPNIGIGQVAFATTPTEDAFLDAIEPLFAQTSEGIPNERIAFCGNGFINAFNKKIKNATNTRINYNGVLNVYGMKLDKFITPFGEIAFKTHPLLTHNTLYTNSALVISPQLVRMRDLRATKMEDQIQTPGQDSQKGQWITETGVEIRHRSLMKHFHITNPAS